jgi:hypothetical protein
MKRDEPPRPAGAGAPVRPEDSLWDLCMGLPFTREFPLAMTSALVESRMVGTDPTVKAVAKALLDARMNPGALIRISCSDAIEAAKVCCSLANSAVSNDLHKERDTVGVGDDGYPIMELRNGSEIQVTIARKG